MTRSRDEKTRQLRGTFGKRRTSDEDLIDLAKKRFAVAESASASQKKRELDDLQFAAGDQWDAEVRTQRAGRNATNGMPPVPARPCLTIDKTKERIASVVNQERQADLGITLVPADDFGGLGKPPDQTEVQLREGLVRRIQRQSEAKAARSWAYDRAVKCGQGYYRITKRFVEGKSFDQDIFIERIYNQNSVTLDPAHEQPDGSDAEWAFDGIDMPWDQYAAEFGEAADGEPNPVLEADRDTFRALGDEAPEWFRETEKIRHVRVMNYYWIARESRELLQIHAGQDANGPIVTNAWADELKTRPDKSRILQSRRVSQRVVHWAKIDGVQVFEQTVLPGRFIPIIKVVGRELQPYDSERRREGMIRPARDAQKGYNFMVSKQVESVGTQPMPPYQVAEGQIEGYEQWYQVVNTRNLPYLPYKQTDLQGRPAGPPIRTAVEAPIQAVANSVALFDAGIASTTNIPDPTLGTIDPTIKGQAAMKLALRQAAVATNDFLDNLVRSVTHEATILNEWIPSTYERPGRIVQLVTGQNQPAAVPLHVPVNGANGTPPHTFTFTDGLGFNVAVKVSKTEDTRRQEEAEQLASLLEAAPGMLNVIGDVYFDSLDGPASKTIAQRMKIMLDPRIQAAMTGQTPLPPEAQAMIGQLKAQVAELQKLADANAAKVRVAEIGAQAGIAEAEIKAGVEDAKRRIEILEAMIGVEKEVRLEGASHLHDAAEAERDRAHERTTQGREHAHALASSVLTAQLRPAPTPTEPAQPTGAEPV